MHQFKIRKRLLLYCKWECFRH